MRGRAMGWGMGLCVGLGASSALAQAAPSTGTFGDPAAPAPSAPSQTAPPAPAPAPAEAAPDIVRLKNGGMLRGKISELDPDGSVTIVTIKGDTRVLPMSAVDYAGSAARDPQAAPALPSVAPAAAEARPYVSVHAAEARIHFLAPDDTTTFYRRAGSAYAEVRGGSVFAKGYERICTAPCEASLPSGRETFAFGTDDKEPKDLTPVALPPGNLDARLSFKDRSGARIAGWLLLLGGPLIGTGLFYADLQRGERDSSPALAIGCLSAFGIGLGVGIPLVRMKDAPVFDVSPAEAAASRPAVLARGLAVSGKF